MKTILTALLLASLTALAAQAESNEQKGKRLVDECLAALGGRAFLAMQDRDESGRGYTFYREKLSGLTLIHIYTRYLPKPGQPEANFLGVEVRQALSKKQDDVYLYGPSDAYEITYRGARPVPDAQNKQFKENTRHNIFYILRQRLDEPGMVFESRGWEFVDNRPVEIVDITDSNNQVTTVSFDQQTKLPVRQRFVSHDPINNDKREEISIFDKYRDVGGGVMWPFTTLRERNGEKISELFCDSVSINQELKESMFTLPAGLKILPKEK